MSQTQIDLNAAEAQPSERTVWPVTWLDDGPHERAILKVLLESLPVAIYVTDPQGRIVFYNREAVQLWGSEPAIGDVEWNGPWCLLRSDGSPLAPNESPLAVALRQGTSLKRIESIARRADGTTVQFLSYPAPLYDGGDLIGGVNMLVEVTGREHPDYLADRLAAIVEGSQDAVISKDLNGTVITWNPAAERLFGYAASEAVGRSITMLIPQERLPEEMEILGKIRRGERVAGYETVRQRKDGTRVDVSLTISPLRDSSGKIVGASKIARDITERKRAQQYQSLLLREMGHRVKNLLAIASGLVALSARSAETPQAMAKAVQERLGAYSKAHELTRPEAVPTKSSQRVSVRELIQTITSPYTESIGPQGESNIEIEGVEVDADGNAAPCLALALHEFTTNAAKYGALSVRQGRVHIGYGLRDGVFELVWRECGGPRITGIPEKSGFGTLLVSRTVQGQLGGRLAYDWLAEGVTITLQVPVDRLAAEKGADS